MWGRGGPQLSSKIDMLAVPLSKPKATTTVDTKAIGHTGKMKMTRHGLMPPPSSLAAAEARRTMADRRQWRQWSTGEARAGSLCG